MIKMINRLRKKYTKLAQDNCTYVSIDQVINDLYQLEQEARLKRIPKAER